MPSYKTIHRQLDALKLPAKYHPCIWCGLTADHWAYQWDDPAEISESGQVWSENTTSYAAMCRSCHKSFDRAHAAYGPERFPYEAACRQEAAYAAVSDERREAEAESRAIARKAALSFIEAEEARMKRGRRLAVSPASKEPLARMSRGYRHNSAEVSA
ncbi:hypothetical protein [Streptomyces hygroscopicus]|uniref:hypothetical protein n=1 Tax=Streptomyces hygroscopicus TaxID=1912 RepID=UPI0004C83DB9|nr:hypothetical protein [Streptomyces hygroscopicus]